MTFDFTGERMRTDEPGNAQGPRMKIIDEGEICSTAPLAFNISGLECQQPPGADLLAGYICTTPPSMAAPFLHRWGGITMNACGRFQLCHCNELCDVKSNWVRAGYLEVEPVLTYGSMSAPLPGCAAYLPTLPPVDAGGGAGEILQKTLVTTYVSIDGGLRPMPHVLGAIAQSFAVFTQVRSELLDALAPRAADVAVTDYNSISDARRLQGCEDDDAAFQEEAAKASVSVASCQEAVTLLGSVEQVCEDLTLAQAAPRLEGASQAKLYMPAGAEASCWATGATLAVAAVTIFRAMRRRNWSRVSLGPSGGCFYDMKFRAKPGDKFKYRYSTDVWEPEWGIIPEEKGRLIRYGQRFRKGTVVKPMVDDDDDDEGWGALGGAGDVGTGALLLDCDGTLAETERDGHRVAFNKAFEEKGFDVEWDVELYGELLTTGGGKERMTRYFKDYNPKAWIFEDPPAKDHPVIMELHELKTRIFMEIVKSGDLPLREGIKDLISAADEAGWQLAVCSTSNEASVTAVVETMLPDFAPKMRIFAGDVVSAKKPDPVPGTEHPETSGDRAGPRSVDETILFGRF
ncbi:unnamed protein product [Durusdinium trenchii]|uniref:Uncharacterized protein n=1 Tax=Durusdinium trenchii TaxID=1381693 RepID=A0ABP0QTT2_9DINO